jgi:hypothetical protein
MCPFIGKIISQQNDDSFTIQSNSISQDLDCHWQIVKLLPILFVYTDFAPFLHRSVSYILFNWYILKSSIKSSSQLGKSPASHQGDCHDRIKEALRSVSSSYCIISNIFRTLTSWLSSSRCMHLGTRSAVCYKRSAVILFSSLCRRAPPRLAIDLAIPNIVAVSIITSSWCLQERTNHQKELGERVGRPLPRLRLLEGTKYTDRGTGQVFIAARHDISSRGTQQGQGGGIEITL